MGWCSTILVEEQGLFEAGNEINIWWIIIIMPDVMYWHKTEIASVTHRGQVTQGVWSKSAG